MAQSEAGAEIFDVNLHPDGLTDQDLESMQLFGLRAALVPAHHAHQKSSESTSKQLLTFFEQVVHRQLPRLERQGIRAYAALGIHPLAVPRRGLHELLHALPGFFRGGKVVAVGPIGLSRDSGAEEEAFLEQLALARRLSLRAIVHAPSREKERLTRRMLVAIRESGVTPSRILVDRCDGRTLPLVLACGHYAGLTIHPDELSGERGLQLVSRHGSKRLVVGSGAGLGASDILSLPRLMRLLARAELSSKVIRHIAWRNPSNLLNVQPASSDVGARRSREIR